MMMLHTSASATVSDYATHNTQDVKNQLLLNVPEPL